MNTALGESIFGSQDKLDDVRRRRKEEDWFSKSFTLLLHLTRIIHLTSAMITSSFIVISACFDNVLKDIKILNHVDPVKIINQSGILMNISGFVMVYLMRSLQRNSGSLNSKHKRAQQSWLQMMPKKLLLSLLLTPMTDRIIYLLFQVTPKGHKGVREAAKAMMGQDALGQDYGAADDDIFDQYMDDEEGDGEALGAGGQFSSSSRRYSIMTLFAGGQIHFVGESGMPLSKEAVELLRVESIDQLVLMLKTMVVICLYAYSVFVKYFREANNNFSDSEDGLTKVIDSMIKKIV
mmetsp:Transcript_11794/g.19918  ORF Transcript_11794/g.19918 Transcript_11794/m.19918 type:complete len:293 (-) Transcript_11794:33-911(-)